MQFLKRTWCEIDLSTLQDNIKLIRSTANKPLMAVVKANAYGHGDKQIARTCQAAGIEAFGVSNVNEALMLRKYGITGTILILGYTDPDYAPLLACHHLSQTIIDLPYAQALSAKAKGSISVHLKLDTGMGRVGFSTLEALPMEELLAVCALDNLHVDGIFSHFSCSDSFEADDVFYTEQQQAQFDACVQALAKQGVTPRMIHLQNSAGILNYTDDQTNIARAGIVLYGLKPSQDVSAVGDNLKPVLSIKTIVQQVKTIKAGSFISYGRSYQADQDVQIAALAVGYADGYPRLLSNRGVALIQGVRCPIVGRVCMDQMMVDVSALYQAGKTVSMGEIATLVGTDAEETLPIDELAYLCNTINYELTCGIARRVPRVYLQDGAIIDVIDDSLHLSL